MVKPPHSCKLCLGTDSVRIPYVNQLYKLRGAENAKMFDAMEIQVCRKCGFGEVCTEIDQERLSRFYELEYRSPESHEAIDYEHHYPVASSRDFSQYVDTRRNSLAQFDTFLDIGPGYGGALRLVSFLNPACSIYALEANPDAASCFKKAIRNFKNTSHIDEIKSVSIVFMSHVLEHMTHMESLNLLVMLRSKIKGALMAEVPHVDFRHFVHSQDAPHLQFFSEESFRKLLISAGYNILYSSQTGNPLKRGDGLAQRMSACRSLNDLPNDQYGVGTMSHSVKTLKNTAARIGFSGLLDVLNVYRLTFRYAEELSAENRFEADCLRIVAEPAA